MIDRIRDLVQRAVGATALPESPAVLIGAALLIAALLIVPQPVWRFSGLLVTVVHELGHGFAGLVTGRRAVSIRLSSDHAGLTESRGTRASVPWTTFWGYPVPALVGAALVVTGMSGWAAAAIACCAAMLVLALLFMRGMLAWFITPLAAGAGIAGLLWAPDPWLSSAVVGLGLFLICGGARALGSLLRGHARGHTADSDARLLARATGVPAAVWLALFIVLTAGAAAAALAAIIPALDGLPELL